MSFALRWAANAFHAALSYSPILNARGLPANIWMHSHPDAVASAIVFANLPPMPTCVPNRTLSLPCQVQILHCVHGELITVRQFGDLVSQTAQELRAAL